MAAPGPIDTKGLASDFLQTHIAPEPAIQALVAIIAHHEIGLVGDGHGTEIITWIDRAMPQAADDAEEEEEDG